MPARYLAQRPIEVFAQRFVLIRQDRPLWYSLVQIKGQGRNAAVKTDGIADSQFSPTPFYFSLAALVVLLMSVSLDTVRPTLTCCMPFAFSGVTLLHLNLQKVRRFYESSAERVDMIIVSGGDEGRRNTKNKCQHGSHSFLGLQKETATEVSNWIKGKDFRTRISS